MTSSPASLHHLIQTELQREIDAYPESAREVVRYLCPESGKLLRAHFALCLSASLGGVDERQQTLLVAVELLHNATLLHDDLIDRATLRRGKPPAHQAFSFAKVVLAGDYLFARSVALITSLMEKEISQDFGRLLPDIIEGEFWQIATLERDKVPSPEDCLVTNTRKTALLFAFATKWAVWLSQRSLADEGDALARCLGVAFQIQDDLMDYKSSKSGKQQGQDLMEGKWTLPAVLAFETLSQAQQTDFLRAWQERSLPAVTALIETGGGFEKATKMAEQYLLDAESRLACFPKGVHRDFCQGHIDSLKTLH